MSWPDNGRFRCGLGLRPQAKSLRVAAANAQDPIRHRLGVFEAGRWRHAAGCNPAAHRVVPLNRRGEMHPNESLTESRPIRTLPLTL